MCLRRSTIAIFGFLALAILATPRPASVPARAAPPATDSAAVQGDVTCDSSVNSVDSLQILRDVAGLGTTAQCLAEAGDVNCDGGVNSVDSLRILRYVAGLTVTAPDGCAPIGEPMQPPPTSEALIAAALEAGDITYPESLLDRAYALFEDPRLPDQFHSPVVDYHAAMGLFAEVLENQSSLSQQLLDDLAPFMARPSDPISIFNNPPTQQARGAAAAVDWYDESAAGGNVRVWVKGDVIGGGAYLHTWSAEVTRVWNALPGIFRYGLADTSTGVNGNPDDAIDIYFASVGDLDPRKAACQIAPQPPECVYGGAGGGYTGYVAPYSGNTSASYIMIDSAVTGPMLTSHIAHELMHVGQHAYDIYEPFWLKDATATWGAVRVLQKLGVSRQPNFDYLPDFFAGLDKALTRDTEADLNRYGSWLFFLFASMEEGDGIVTSIWNEAAAPGEQNENAVDLVFPFATYFDDFAVRNWNKKPPLVKAYKDADGTFPQDHPRVNSVVFLGAGNSELGRTVQNLASVYYSYQFGPTVRKVTFKNELQGVPDAHIWAIKKIGDDWKKPEDWTSEKKKVFCRNLDDEDLTELVLIVSNSHLKNPLPTSPAAKIITEESCVGWLGTATGTNHYDVSSEGVHDRQDAVTTAHILWEEDNIFAGCNCTSFFATGVIDWTVNMAYESNCCTCSDSVEGHMEAGEVPHDQDQMLIIGNDPNDDAQYWYVGRGRMFVDAFLDCGIAGVTSLPVNDFFDVNDATIPDIPEPTPTPTPTPNATPFAAGYRAAAASNMCDEMEYGTFRRDATTFSGSCYTYYDSPDIFEKFEWSFTWVSDPPQ